jgi:hypothetical protein
MTFHSKRERHRGEPVSFLVMPHVHANSEGTIKQHGSAERDRKLIACPIVWFLTSER